MWRHSGHADRSGPIHDDLRHRIITLRLPPGSVLRPKEIAERHGVSVTPVRAALLRLHQEGLVDIRPQARTTVSRISLAALQSAYVLRLALETEVTGRLAGHADREKLAPAREAVDRHADAAPRGEERMCRDAGRSFHGALFQAVGGLGLMELLDRKSGPLRRVDYLMDEPDEMAIVDTHHTILRGIQSGDGDGASALMRQHIDMTSRHIAAAVHKAPDWFCP